MFHWITDSLIDFFLKLGMHSGLAKMCSALIVVACLIGVAFVFYLIINLIVVRAVKLTHRKKPMLWWEKLLDKKFFKHVAALLPAFLVQKMIPQFFYEGSRSDLFFSALTNIYIIINVMLIISAFMNALGEVLLHKEATKDKPIKSYIQILMVVLWGIAVILVISILLNKSPAGLLAGIGAFSAVLLLVFQDMIIGFVNSIQLSSNDLIRNGDWITMNKFGVDGDVEEVNLLTVKVRNFDKTISTIPVKQLLSDSFQNWRPIQDLGIRRIKRSFNVDVTSIKPCTPEMLERFKKIGVLKDYIISVEKEIAAYNEELNADTSLIPNGRHQTNIGVLRAYIEAYLKNNPNISQQATCMVRQLAPDEYGQPLEIYCFTATSAWLEYEDIQADVFDHIYSVLSYFEIRAYQRDAGKNAIAMASSE
ncbi:mechanosensitive ion channel family protein [Bacteroidales bacterium OttesenSCG-928-B11]|nr:mechanosensitive ion channel family protein [Bacteroidales bacterium OttesenSCG-928-C03]MDL2311846.1 mechanosensitive ion channel family protein [Bacteroidales bacterium OttesenSCG-928-B11]MDL2325505.1 mechanosensitive ion channel family protein [Bacteroidales bacterium OttesenSCG-928-A14]